MLRYIFVLLLFCFLKTKADAGPKFFESVNIQLFNEQRPFSKVDSIAAFVFTKYETELATLNYSTEQYWTGATMDERNGIYKLTSRHGFESFKLFIFLRGKKYESAILSHFPGNGIYYLEIKNGKLQDVSPPFHQHMGTYFLLLLVTLFTEVLLGLIYFNKYKPLRSLKDYLFSFIAINIITHVVLWYTYSHAAIPMFFLEILVFAIESLYWRFYFKAGFFKALLYSFITNFASWIIGGIVWLFI